MSTHLATTRIFDRFVEVAVDLIFNAVVAEVNQNEVVFPVVKGTELLDATILKGNAMRAVWITTTPSRIISF